ncbi:MAG: pyridoxal-phosphate dependent enzyme [Bacteroidetes bacterium]|nr:pyridoxal-phosphate dependent enzyme [Bacteroidota bacterium]
MDNLTQPDIDTINQAHNRIRNYIHRTPIHSSQLLNKIIGAEIYFKCENFQKVGAFKSRGAVNAVYSLSEDQLKYGVCTHSSGNHAQALARAAKLRNTKAFIVMPENAPIVKVDAVKQYSGEITFCKPTLEARENTIKEIIKKTKATEIHPYNDYRIIAGQATAAKEFIEDRPELDIIMVPVGGGGLLSGTALATKFLSPKTRVIAAEPENANDAYRSFNAKKFYPSIEPKTIADGLLTSLGTLTFPIIIKYVDQIVTVSEPTIIEAMKLIWERLKIIIEASSAVPLASMMENKFDFQNKKIGIIISGGNIDLSKVPF